MILKLLPNLKIWNNFFQFLYDLLINIYVLKFNYILKSYWLFIMNKHKYTKINIKAEYHYFIVAPLLFQAWNNWKLAGWLPYQQKLKLGQLKL